MQFIFIISHAFYFSKKTNPPWGKILELSLNAGISAAEDERKNQKLLRIN